MAGVKTHYHGFRGGGAWKFRVKGSRTYAGMSSFLQERNACAKPTQQTARRRPHVLRGFARGGTCGHGSSLCTPQAWPHSRQRLPARSAMNEPDKEYAAALARGCRHMQDVDAVAIRMVNGRRAGITRTLSSHWHGCSGHSHALDVIIVRAWVLWPFARTGHTDVIIVRAWMIWPFARTGRYHCAGMGALAIRVLCCGVTSGLRAKPEALNPKP